MVLNPYSAWLQIPPREQPPNDYQLLGIPVFEADAEAISTAARKRMVQAQMFASAGTAQDLTQLLEEIKGARSRLLDPETKAAYDLVLGADFAVPRPAASATPRLEAARQSRQPALPIAESPPRSEAAGTAALQTLRPKPPPLPALTAFPAPTIRPAALPSAAGREWNMPWMWTGFACLVLVNIGVFASFVALRPSAEKPPLLAQDAAPAAVGPAVEAPRLPISEMIPSEAATAPRPQPGEPSRGAGAQNPVPQSTDPGDVQPSPAAPVLPEESKPKPPPPLAESEKPAPQAPRSVAASAEPSPPPASELPLVSKVGKAAQIALPSFRTAGERAAYLKLVEKLLDEGVSLTLQPKGLETAGQQAQAARRLCDRDPRLAYSHGLVCIHYLKLEDAQVQFDAAAAMPGEPYLPAWQARIWLNVRRKGFAIAADQLLELAVHLEHAATAPADEASKRDCAAWIGHMIAYLQQPAGLSARETAQISQRDQAIAETLQDSRRAAYATGKQQVANQYEDLLQQLDQAGEQTLKRHDAQVDIEKDDIANKKERLRDQQDKLEMSAEQAKQWIDEQLAGFDKQLAQLEREYIKLEAEGRAISNSIQELKGQIGSLEMARGPKLNPSSDLETTIQGKKIAVERLSADYSVVEKLALAVREQAFGVLQKRAAAVARYQAATGQLVKQSDNLRKWNGILDKKDKNLPTSKAAKSAATKSLELKLRSVKTYVDVDLEAEKQRVLDSYPEP
jgi:hypothetical protein